MTTTRLALRALAECAALAFTAATATVANAAPSVDSSTCTTEQRATLKADITSLHAQITASRLTAQQREDRRTARKAAVAQLKAQAHGGTWDATAIATAKAALQKAKADLAAATDPTVKATLRANVASLREQLAGLRGTKLTDEQRATLKGQIDALVAADKQENATRHADIQKLKDQLRSDAEQLRACRA